MDHELFAVLGERIKDLRVEHGYTNQREFAELIGIDAPRLSRIERGQRGIDTLVLRRAAQVLDVSLDDFFEAPATAVALPRGDEAVDTMLDWARALQANIETVERYADTRA
jgi:transcriptional regulator with XRE-family HTH domain